MNFEQTGFNNLKFEETINTVIKNNKLKNKEKLLFVNYSIRNKYNNSIYDFGDVIIIVMYNDDCYSRKQIYIQEDKRTIKNIRELRKKNYNSQSENKIDYELYCGSFYTDPTANCQMMSFASFDSFINKVANKNIENVDIVDYLFLVLSRFKNTALIDIKKDWFLRDENIKNILTNHNLFYNEYENLTNSKMIFFNFNIRDYLNKINKNITFYYHNGY